MKNIWLIRHSESHSNTGEKTTHPGTSELTRKGELQSACIASSIQRQPDVIIHSPYARALQSAQPTIDKFPGAAVDEWPVEEFIYLPHESYLNSTQAERQHAVSDYWERCDPTLKHSAEAESFIEFIERMEILVQRLLNRQEHIVIFTHGHVIRAMIWKIITGTLKKDNIAMSQYRSLRHALYIPNAVILKISMDEQELQMSQLITAHVKSELLT